MMQSFEPKLSSAKDMIPNAITDHGASGAPALQIHKGGSGRQIVD
jgi:hypothetical protein